MLRIVPSTVPTLSKLPLDYLSAAYALPLRPPNTRGREGFLDKAASLRVKSLVVHAQLRPAVYQWEFSSSTWKVFLPDVTRDTATFQDILEMVYQNKVWGTVYCLHVTFF